MIREEQAASKRIRFWASRIGTRATHLWTTASQEDDMIRRWRLDPKRVVCVSNGVDLELFSRTHDRAEVRREASVPIDSLLFG